jgi:hypothetical protein
VSARERSITLVLLAAVLTAWTVVAVLVTTVDPTGDARAILLGALTMGSAVGLTLWLFLWWASRGAPGAVVSSGRRGGLGGLVVSILVVLRALDALVLPVALFLVAGAVLVELAFSMRR